MPTKPKKKRNKKYVKPVCIGWVGYGYIDYENYRCYFEIHHNSVDQSIQKNIEFSNFLADSLEDFAKDDGIELKTCKHKLLGEI